MDAGHAIKDGSKGAVSRPEMAAPFQANHTGNAGKPTAFSLNGAACTVA